MSEEQELSSTTSQPNLGETRLAWEFPEFVKYQRGFWWYTLAVVALLGFITYSIFSQNYIFIVLILLFGFIVYLRDQRVPARLTIQIRERGIQLGDRGWYRWSDMKGFWIVYEPPEVKNLYLDFRGLRPSISVSLENQNPLEVRKLLGEHVIEDTERENESFSDGFGRIFKI